CAFLSSFTDLAARLFVSFAFAALFPQEIRLRFPVFRVRFAAAAEGIYTFRSFVVGGFGIGCFYHGAELFRILQHRTWTEHVVVERLSVMISHEDRALQSFQQGTFADIGVGVVDEYTRLHITFCINMRISSSSGDTSADILCVVLEVHGEDRFGLTELTDPLVNFCTLFRVWKKFRNGSVSYRHIMEEPDEQCA